MPTDFRSLANPYISKITPYQPGKPIEAVERELGIRSAIKLASNENPLGPSPKALDAAAAVLPKMYFYPDGGNYELKQALAKKHDVLPTQIIIGNGSENVLELIMKAYLNPHSAAIISEYAFLTISILINSYGAKEITVPAKNFAHDIKGMVAAVTKDTRIIFVVNPNNPTGTYTNEADLLYLLDSVSKDVLVVVDEAYSEYISASDYPDTIKLLKKYPNLIVTRTFSKIYGLAGLRLGYSLSSPEIADMLNRARLPFNVNMVADAAGRAAIEDYEHIAMSIELNQIGMQQLEDGFKKLNIEYIPSLGNFITFKSAENANDVYQKLLYKGVIVRPLGAYKMPNHLRVTIGTAEQNEIFLKALKEVKGS